MNYVTVKDSNVSLSSTATGISPRSSLLRYSKEARGKKEIGFPNVVVFYNKLRIALHDCVA